MFIRFVLIAVISVLTFAWPAPSAPQKDPLTPDMRTALAKINKIHGGMERETIDEAVAEFHRVIAKSDPKVFVQFAVPHLMRLAPKDIQTRQLLRKALVNGWMDEFLLRAFLIQAGDEPGPHLRAMIKALDSKDAKTRRSALQALPAVGKEGSDALPKLRDIVTKAKADPSDYVRDYTIVDAVPEHVLAHWAITRIEAAIDEAKKK